MLTSYEQNIVQYDINTGNTPSERVVKDKYSIWEQS
jgi:hypothetical protein